MSESEQRIPLIHSFDGRTTLTTPKKWETGAAAFIANGFRKMTNEEIDIHFEEVTTDFDIVRSLEKSGEIKEIPPIETPLKKEITEKEKPKSTKKEKK